MASGTSLKRRAKQKPSTYRRHALTHPAQAFVLAIPGMLAIVTLSFVLPLTVLLLGEGLILLLLPKLDWFRRDVDEILERSARTEAAERRAALLSRMSEDHRLELERIERLSLQIRERSGESEEPEAPEWLGLGELIAIFVRIAIAHRTAADSFRPVDRARLDEQLAWLEAMNRAASEPTQPWIERRLAIAQRRAEAWDHARAEQEVLAHGLATIGELVRWMHEQCSTARTEPARLELERLLTSWERNGTALRELSNLCDVEEVVDPTILALGRDAVTDCEPRLLVERSALRRAS